MFSCNYPTTKELTLLVWWVFTRVGGGTAEAVAALGTPMESPVPVKWALMQMGHIQSGIRLPLVALGDGHHEAVHSALRESCVLP